MYSTIRPSELWMILFLHRNRDGGIKHYINCSRMDPLQWMGAVRMRVQTSDKNITIIHKLSPVNPLISCDVKSCVFVRNKSIFKSIIDNNVSSSEKVHPLVCSYIEIHQHISLELFSLVNSAWSVHISLLIQMTDFFVKTILMMDCFLK